MQEVMNDHPEIAKKLKTCQREKIGRPKLEEDQPGLLATIKQLAIFGGSADDRRRTEAIRSCRTLDAYTQNLKGRIYAQSQCNLLKSFTKKFWQH